jgi:tetratricopeptide (TPR) repeat protein
MNSLRFCETRVSARGLQTAPPVLDIVAVLPIPRRAEHAMPSRRPRWKPFPFESADYDCPGIRLKRRWSRLHQGDREPYPDIATVRQLVEQHPEVEPRVPIDKATERLQEAWRAYHRGDFAAAVELGLSLGLLGYNVANKAANIHATYLEADDRAKLTIFLDSATRAEGLQAHAPGLCNAWYLHAQALGRYAQGISVMKALAEGIGGKVKTSLECTLQMDDRHADAHVALGAYHAELVQKLGSFAAGLTYGASEAEAVKHFRKALTLNPHSAIAHIEYAKGLERLFGKAKFGEMRRHYEQAAHCRPADAMERLDTELAKQGPGS